MITFQDDEWVADFMFARIYQHDVDHDYRYFFYSWFVNGKDVKWFTGFVSYRAAVEDAMSRIIDIDPKLILNGEHL